MKKTIFTILSVMFIMTIQAQRNVIFSPNINTLQVVISDNWLQPPVVTLGSDEPINISFDEMSHAYHRYTYKVEHCEADWSTSKDIFESDYLEGFNNNIIDNYVNSVNTTELYTRYSFQIPNAQCRLKISGNYKVCITDEESGDKILEACFMVVEPTVSSSMSILTNTDIDVNKSHQQLDLQVDYGNLNITDPTSQIYTVIMQNYRWDNAVINPRPNYIGNNKLTWTHNRNLIFDGSNEYRKFEMLDVHHPTMGIEHIDYVNTAYHFYPFESNPRLNYLYDEDANGAFYIRNSDNVDNDYTCDYVWVHYTMYSERVEGKVYINGWWTNDSFENKYEMQYNNIKKCYEATILQKQGYYSYQYIVMREDGTTTFLPAEGSFFETENSYQALIYYKATGERTFKLVAYKNLSTR
jgi:hypothetical protein